MSSLEPPVPAAAAGGFGATELGLGNDDTDDLRKYSISQKGWLGRLGKWRKVVGLVLLALVVFLWTATNFLASVRWTRATGSAKLQDAYLIAEYLGRQLVQQTIFRHISQHSILRHPICLYTSRQSVPSARRFTKVVGRMPRCVLQPLPTADDRRWR